MFPWDTYPHQNVVDFNVGSPSMPILRLASNSSVENPENMGGNWPEAEWETGLSSLVVQVKDKSASLADICIY